MSQILDEKEKLDTTVNQEEDTITKNKTKNENGNGKCANVNKNGSNYSSDEDNSSGEDSDNDKDDIFDKRYAFFKFSSYSSNILRNIKTLLEENILRKLKNFDSIQKSELTGKQKCVYYYKNYAIDKVGNQITLGETGIAEGWNIPKYENEFQDLLGLPFTEDHALSERLRIKKPRLECFNCLSTGHRVQDCPVKIDQERIDMHRNTFNSQAQRVDEQNSFNRYTSDLDSKSNRGFVPGKISNQLREALGVKENQLPPYVYVMRLYGYPIGWLLEARVKQQSKLVVLDGDQNQANKKDEGNNNDKKEDGIINSDDDEKTEKAEKKEETIFYDEDKIYSFEGFNQPPSTNIIDESDRYCVKRYSNEFSREKFLSTLNLENKKKIVRRNKNKSETHSDSDSVIEEDKEENKDEVENSEQTMENLELDDSNDAYSSPKKQKIKNNEDHGTSFTEILGTPIVNNVTNITSVPNWEKFSESICPHKPFDMNESLTQTSTGSYKDIVKLTREFRHNTSF